MKRVPAAGLAVMPIAIGAVTMGVFGGAGTAGALALPAPIVGMISNGAGYTLIANNGTLYPFK